MNLNLWKRIRQWAQRHEKQAFLEKHCVNLKCPHCNTWWSAADGDGRLESIGHPIATAYICGQCAKPSYWICEAGFWFQAKEWGITIEAQQPATQEQAE